MLFNTSSDQTLSENLSFLHTQLGTSYVRTEFCFCGGIGQIEDTGNFDPVVKIRKRKNMPVLRNTVKTISYVIFILK